MRLVGDHREPLALRRRQLAHGLEREGEGLDGADHDLLAAGQRLRQLAALAAALALDRRHHAGRALEVEERLLQLGVDHVAVGDHQHGVEQLLVLRVVQVGQEVRRPGDGVRLARAGRVLDQILAARPVRQHRGLQLARGVELVEAREDDLLDLLLLVPLGDEVAAEDLQPALPRPDLLPQVGRAMPAVSGSPGCPPRRRRPG